MDIIYGKDLANKKFERLENGDLREIPTGKFVPGIGEEYWFLYPYGFANQTVRNDGYSDKWNIKHNKVFRTKEECEEYRHFLEVLDKYTFEPNWNDGSQAKLFIRCDHCINKVSVGYSHFVQHGSVYFESEEKYRAFVDEVGEEAVKRFMFDIWE